MISLVSNFLFTACFTVFLFKFFFPVTAGTWVDMVFLFDGNWACHILRSRFFYIVYSGSSLGSGKIWRRLDFTTKPASELGMISL